MAKNVNDYLEGFKKRGVTDKVKLKLVFDKGMQTLTGADKIAFKNAYEIYNQGLGSNSVGLLGQTKNITSKITKDNSQSVINRANELKSSGKIGEADYLKIRNQARNIGFNEIKTDNNSIVTNAPGNNTNIKNHGTTNTTGAQINTNNINTAQNAGGVITDTIKSNINTTNKQQETIQKKIDERMAEDLAIKEKAIKDAEEEAKKKQDLYKDTNQQVIDLENKIAGLIDERKNRDVVALEAKKQSELDKLSAEQDLQKYKDEQSIKEAQKQVEVASMKSAWAFNRMGAGFSSAAIGTTQRIATEGATAIAGLKLQATANQSGFAKDIANLEFNYTKEINGTIDKYTDASIELDNQSIKRIYDLQNNMLLSEKEKNDTIKKESKKYLMNKRNNEDELYKEMERLRDKQLNQVKELEQQLVLQENTGKTKINDLILSGQWNSISPIQQAEFLKRANMSQSEVKTALKSIIYNGAYKLIQSVLGSNFLPSVAQMDNIQSEVERMMLAGRGLEEAINIATNRIIKSIPEYTKNIESKNKTGSKTSGISTTQAQILAMAKANGLDISSTEAKVLANLDGDVINTMLKQMKANPGFKAADYYTKTDDQGNEYIINKKTQIATPVLKQDGTKSEEFLMSTKEGIKGTGSFYDVPTYTQFKPKVSGSKNTTEEAYE